MKGTPAPLLIEVRGAGAAQVEAQSLQNVWRAGEDAVTQRLAVVEVRQEVVVPDLLERLTWALLAWPDVCRLRLCDRQTGTEVAAVERHPDAPERADLPLYQWQDHWLPTGAAEVTDAARSDAGEAALPFPPRPPAGLARLLGLDEQAAARREQHWQRLRGLLGERAAVLAYRTFQRVAGFYRRRSADTCPVEPGMVERLLGQTGRIQQQVSGGFELAILMPRLSPGGAEKNGLDLAEALVRAGWGVHLITTYQSANSWSARARARGVSVVHLPDFLPAACWLGFLRVYLQRRSIRIVHINNSHWMYEHLQELKQVLPDIRVVSQLHAEGRPGARDYLTLASRGDAWIDRHSVISDYLRGRLVERYGIDPAKIDVVRTGIDLAVEFDATRYARGSWRQRHGLAGDAPLLAFVGRFSDLKRPLLFLDVASRLLAERPDLRFVMKGDGPLRVAIDKRLAADERLRHAVVVEDATEAVAPLMTDADLLVLTSAMEGIAYVSYEAMALGLVQVSAAVGAQAELITPECGVLVATGSGEAERFASAILALLGDPRRRQTMAAAARQRIRHWPSVADMAAGYHRLYRTLLDADRVSGEQTQVDTQKRGTA